MPHKAVQMVMVMVVVKVEVELAGDLVEINLYRNFFNINSPVCCTAKLFK